MLELSHELVVASRVDPSGGLSHGRLSLLLLHGFELELPTLICRLKVEHVKG